MSTNKKMLGEVLVESNLISDTQLAEALAKQRTSKKRLGEIVVELGFVSEKDLYTLLANEMGFKYVSLQNAELDTNIVSKINQNLAQKHSAIPINIENDKLVVAMTDPSNILALDDISIYTNMEITPVFASPREIAANINKYYGEQVVKSAVEEFKIENGLSDAEIEGNDSTKNQALEAPIIKMVNSLIEQAIRSRASDIHIEPHEKFAKVRFRIDGSLKNISQIDPRILPAIVTRIKISGGMNIAEKRRPQDGRASFSLEGIAFDLRISTVPTVFGEKVVMRLTDKRGILKSKDALGLSPEDMKTYDDILKSPNGIILVTGPTGSGKSTTLYATLRELSREDVNVVTVEDPVESVVPGINQVQVNAKAGVDFASVLRTFLRQDPDIIMVGEIRDSETANIAVRAAITGHLVLSTLHTNDAPSTIARLVDMGIEPFLLSTSLNGIIAQRLVKRLCDKCKEQYEPTDKELSCLDLFDRSEMNFYRPVGCPACHYTGYSGRVGVFEILPITPNIRQLITSNATTEDIKFVAMREGLNTLWRSCSKLVAKGITTFDELIRITYVDE